MTPPGRRHGRDANPGCVARSAVSGTRRTVELQDGTRALIRPIGPWDRKPLNEGFENASAESIFLRFLSPQPRLSSSQLDYLTAIDHIRHEALIAVDPETGQSFGTARYVRNDPHPESAEFAVGVGDRWMRIGLGTALLGALVLRAREMGVIRFTGLIHADNTAIRRLVEKVAGPYEIRLAGQGAMELAVDLRKAGRLSTPARVRQPRHQVRVSDRH
jgi:RimJ/RimL family protein N-acetyltransferase